MIILIDSDDQSPDFLGNRCDTWLAFPLGADKQNVMVCEVLELTVSTLTLGERIIRLNSCQPIELESARAIILLFCRAWSGS